MNVQTWFKNAQAQLKNVEIATARLDCLVLLEDETRKDRAWLLSHPEYELQGSILERLNTKIVQRATHIPLAYIRGHSEFYGREFMVNEHVLVPRPETEAMIELLKRLFSPCRHPEQPGAQSARASGSQKDSNEIPDQVRDDKPLGPGSCILDVGTGSGCLAITAALELPDVFVQACDIDTNCLEIAEKNAEMLGANVNFYQSDLLAEVDACDVLLCNLPYVPDNYEVNTAATHEPRLALFAGHDGLDLFRKLFDQIQSNGWQPHYILTESLPSQHTALAAQAEQAGFTLCHSTDFIQIFSPTLK